MTRLLFVILLLGNNCFGQIVTVGNSKISTDGVYGDNINKSPNLSFNDRIRLVQIDKSPAKIDIRLCTLRSLSNTKTLRRLFMVDTTWSAVEYNESNNPVKIKKYNLKANTGFDSLFLQLVSYNILTLPNQSDLKSKMRIEGEVDEDGYKTERKIYVMDGESYTVEIKIGNKFRVYEFDNPESYSKFYENVNELKDYLHIVQTFDRYFERKSNNEPPHT